MPCPEHSPQSYRDLADSRRQITIANEGAPPLGTRAEHSTEPAHEAAFCRPAGAARATHNSESRPVPRIALHVLSSQSLFLVLLCILRGWKKYRFAAQKGENWCPHRRHPLHAYQYYNDTMTRCGAYWVRPPSSSFGLPLVSLLSPPRRVVFLLIDIFPVYLRCVHLTLNSTIPASGTSNPPPTTSILSPRNTRLLATASSRAQAPVEPDGIVRLRSMSCPSTSAGTGVLDDFACMKRDGARWHCDSV
jgi:hypothetical protein